MRDGRAIRDGIDAKLCTEKLSPWDYLKKKGLSCSQKV